MHKIVIIDGDKDASSCLATMIKDVKCNFEVVAKYASGHEAYESIVSVLPDVIVTDIKFPHIDGFEMLERIKQMLPVVKIIVVTKLNEFLVAKKVANLGVLGFVSKPVIPSDLLSVLDKAESELNKELSLSENIGQLEEFYSKNLMEIRENSLAKLINMTVVPASFDKKLKWNGIDLDYKFMLFCIVDFDAVKSEMWSETIERTVAIILQAVDEDINRQYLSESFTINDKVCIIFKAEEMFNLTDIESYFDVLINKVFKVLNVAISVGISSISCGEHNFKSLFAEASASLDNRQVFGGKKVYFPSKYEQGVPTTVFMAESEFNEITYYIKSKSTGECFVKLANVKEEFVSGSNNIAYFYVVSNILNALFKACNNIEKLSEYGYKDVYRRVFSFKTIDEVFDCFTGLVEAIKSINYEASINNTNRNLELIKAVIANRFDDSGFNLNALAEEVKLSRSYICDLLQSQNTSYVRYLTDIRMEKARELLKNSKNKIMDVTEMVGYNDPYYFSHCFKRYYGVSPREYRLNATK